MRNRFDSERNNISYDISFLCDKCKMTYGTQRKGDAIFFCKGRCPPSEYLASIF